MSRILIATSNAGKLRDFSGAAARFGVEIAGLSGFDSLPLAVEDGKTFEENARKKAEHYSRFAKNELVLADDSGLEVDVLGGMPGVDSALYAALEMGRRENSSDADNNARLLRELERVPDEKRTAHFVCVIAAARDGKTIATFRAEAPGRILRLPIGTMGFGYDPLFLSDASGTTFAQLPPQEKAAVSHRGKAFAKFLDWYLQQPGVAAPHIG
jgi:XTP/dITP diphosphohydrolase